MKRLQENRIELIKKYLQASKLDPGLMPEILDHLACEAEEGLWDGQSFDEVFATLRGEASGQSLLNLSVDHQNLLAMDKSLNDIVFENRNKLYGAYDLRKGYGQTIQRSVIIGSTLFLLMVMLPNLYARLVPEPKADDIIFVVEAAPADIKLEPVAKPVAPPPVEPAVKTIRSVIPVVLPDDQVPIENIPPTTADLANAQPAEKTVEGLNDVDIIAPPVAVMPSVKAAVAGIEPKKEETLLFSEQAPQYSGGTEAMGEFLRKHLKYPRQAAQAGIQGKVFVAFTVGSDGKVDNVSAMKGIGFGCDEEAVRVVKLMQNWLPGKQSGVPVKVRFTLPIAFQLD